MPKVKPIVLAHGGHNSPEEGMCFNEAAAFLAGEQFSDAPACVSPVIRRYTMTLNDRLDDEQRQLLRPFLLRTLGTAGDGRDEERIRMCVEWLAQESALPALLERAGLDDEAAKVRAITPDMTMANIRELLWEVRTAAWNARNSRWRDLRERIKAKLIEKWPADAAAAATTTTTTTTALPAPPKYGTDAYWEWRRKIYKAVYEAVRPIYDQVVNEATSTTPEQRLEGALALLDRMLPPEPVQVPAIENAEELVAA